MRKQLPAGLKAELSGMPLEFLDFIEDVPVFFHKKASTQNMNSRNRPAGLIPSGYICAKAPGFLEGMIEYEQKHAQQIKYVKRKDDVVRNLHKSAGSRSDGKGNPEDEHDQGVEGRSPREHPAELVGQISARVLQGGSEPEQQICQ